MGPHGAPWAPRGPTGPNGVPWGPMGLLGPYFPWVWALWGARAPWALGPYSPFLALTLVGPGA